MIVTTSNKWIDKLRCGAVNGILALKNKHWNRGKYRCECHICGKVLDSREDKWCPEECGWKKLRGEVYNPWVCHQCLEHHDDHLARKQ